MKLAEELKAAGYKGTVDAFRDVITEEFHGMFRSWTDEELMCHPREAVHFCNCVRLKSRLTDIPDSLILRTLTNNRKASRSGGAAPKKKAKKPR